MRTSPPGTLFASLLLFGCPEPEDSAEKPADSADTADSGAPDFSDELQCAEAEARLGHRACVPWIPDDETFSSVTIASTAIDQLRVGKYMVPTTDSARLPGLFLDVNHFTLHYDFLTQAFPDEFPGLSVDQYEALVLHPDTREFYAGTMSIYIEDAGFFYGFTVWDDPLDASTTVTQEQVTAAYEGLQARFAVGELAWVPNSTNQMEAALGFSDTPFVIKNPADVEYEAYNPGDTYGYLRLYTGEEWAEADLLASYSYTDIVVVDEAPEDIQRVVSGIVTGTRQGGLSHLSVRSAARGTPNCYIKGPLDALASWEGQLVHFECGTETWSAEATTEEEAQAFWESIQPDPIDICAPVLDVYAMPNLLDVDVSTAEARHENLCTYGAKGSNLATLYTIVPSEYQLDGFLIPFAYYNDFVNNNTWEVDLGDGGGLQQHSFADTIAAWHADPDFVTDGTLRAERLTALREAMLVAPVDPLAMEAVSEMIREVWGNDTTMVRFRSSSNAEDGLEFSGAGLYDSASSCLADDVDGNSSGPSICDSDKEDERTVEDGLRTVWASVWKLSAWEERAWYGIDPSLVAMGVLCDTRANNELANVVAFSGNPIVAGDDRYLINSQLGELEVVSAEPGVYPEQTLLTLVDGEVTVIDRVTLSSEGEEVLTDAQLQELGSVYYDISLLFPLDDEVPDGHDVVWDSEWKLWEDGQLIIKQIRPFLR